MEHTRKHSAGERGVWTRRRVVRTVAIPIVGGIILAVATARADELVVPDDFPTIQAAVDAAPPGVTIEVRRGTYEEIVVAEDLTLRGLVAAASPRPLSCSVIDRAKPLRRTGHHQAMTSVGGATC